MLIYIANFERGGNNIDNKKNNGVYIQEPTFLSPMNMHFRMTAVKSNGESHEIPKLLTAINSITTTYNDAFTSENTYTLKRKK